jgi:hypothetical protein
MNLSWFWIRIGFYGDLDLAFTLLWIISGFWHLKLKIFIFFSSSYDRGRAKTKALPLKPYSKSVLIHIQNTSVLCRDLTKVISIPENKIIFPARDRTDIPTRQRQNLNVGGPMRK